MTSPAQDIALSIGRGQLVTVPGNMADIFVANDAVADVQVKSQRQLYVFGKAGGQTTVYASNAAGDIIWSANVRVGSNLDSIDQMLALAMPEAKIHVSTMGTNTVLLTGTVAAPEDAAEAERLVSAFVGEGANVVSRLRMATPLQVNLRVRFAEVSRSLIRQLGANLTTVDTTGGFQFGLARGRTITQRFGIPRRPAGNGQLRRRLRSPASARRAAALLRARTAIRPEPNTTLGGFGKFLGLDIARRTRPRRARRHGVDARRAEPDRAFGRDRAVPRRWRVPDPHQPGARHHLGRIQELRRQPGLHADRAGQRPHLDPRASGSVRAARARARW